MMPDEMHAEATHLIVDAVDRASGGDRMAAVKMLCYALVAVVQAPHDAGPRTRMGGLATALALIERGMDAVDEQLGREPEDLLRAAFAAHYAVKDAPAPEPPKRARPVLGIVQGGLSETDGGGGDAA